MQDTKVEPQELGEGVDIAALRERALGVAQSIWRPAATSVAVALILLFGWGVVNGKHGLSAWRQQQIQDRQLRQEIQDLQQENAHLRDHVDRLKNDPNAIEHEAREQLHYAKPGEIIYRLPEERKASDQPAENAK
jgi:cell division protein FtsB